MELGDLQATIEATFGARDRARGADGTFRWWVEEVGEVGVTSHLGDLLRRAAIPSRLAGSDAGRDAGI